MRKGVYWFLAIAFGAALWILVGAIAGHAQTVSPVVSEYGKKASGQFVVINNGLTPLAVVIESQSFQVNAEGKASYRPLDAGIEVKLSQSSARLGPKESRTFDYDIKCSALPCAVTFWAVLTGLHTQEGIALAIHIPHVVYVCDKGKDCRTRTRKAWGVVE